MGRVFFPTYSLNRFGARDTDQQATLGAVERFPAEPTPRAAMTPTRPILGALPMYANGGGTRLYPVDLPRIWPPPMPQPIFTGPISTGPISASGGGGSAPTPTPSPAPVAPPVSVQVGPTPTVTVPPPTPSAPLLVSSGGGTPSVSTPTVVAAAPTTGFVDSLSAWLSGTTLLFNYNVPNALLAGAVVLGFAWLSSGSGKKR